MNWQAFITALLVAGCGSYALWNLMPRVWRGRVATWFGQPAAVASGGCGACDSCGSKPLPKVAAGSAAPGFSVISIVRKPPAA
jgi:hypothetical protein